MKRNKVAFLKPEEPAFIRKIKEKLRYQEGPDVETKRQELNKSDENDVNDREDEVPTVDLENSNVTKEEANSFLESQTAIPEKRNERVIFKKPIKKNDSQKGLVFSSSESKVTEHKAAPESYLERKRKSSTENKKSPKVQLLSFNEEDDE